MVMTYSFADYIRLTAITYQSFGLDKKLRTSFEVLNFLEATIGFEPMHQGVADPRLTTWLCRHIKKMERMTRLELATSTLARWRSTR